MDGDRPPQQRQPARGYLYFVFILIFLIGVGAIEHRWPQTAVPIAIAAGVLFVVALLLVFWAGRRKKAS